MPSTALIKPKPSTVAEKNVCREHCQARRQRWLPLSGVLTTAGAFAMLRSSSNHSAGTGLRSLQVWDGVTVGCAVWGSYGRLQCRELGTISTMNGSKSFLYSRMLASWS